MSGQLHRAYVYPPDSIRRETDSRWTRTVFFEVPWGHTGSRGAYLQQLLASVWHVDAQLLDDCIENIHTERELLDGASFGEPKLGDLCLLASGCGGTTWPAVGPDRVHYESAENIDLFVSPRNAARIHAALQRIECMRLQQERGGAVDTKSPALIVQAAKDEIAQAAVCSKAAGHGPILQVNLRLPYHSHADDILVDGAKLSPATLRALKQLKTPVIRRARPAKAAEGGAA